MTQFNEEFLLENLERLLRHEEEMGTKALTKLYDMTNYITDFNNLSIIKEIDGELSKILFNAKSLLIETLHISSRAEFEEKQVQSAPQIELDALLAKTASLNEIVQKSKTNQYDLSIFNGFIIL